MGKQIIGHHVIGRSKHKEYNISHPDNIYYMEQNKERGLHNLCGALLTPHEQFEYINRIWLPVQSKIIKELTKELENMPIDKWYKDHLYK